ncbi:unnamed protein product, partial [Brenthis ino]
MDSNTFLKSNSIAKLDNLDLNVSELHENLHNNEVVATSEYKEAFNDVFNNYEDTNTVKKYGISKDYGTRVKRQISGTQDNKMMIGTFQAIIRPMTVDGDLLDNINNSQNTTEEEVQ